MSISKLGQEIANLIKQKKKDLVPPAKFIKIPRSFFQDTLRGLDDSAGWVLNFKDDRFLVFRKMISGEVPSFLIEVDIINSNTHGIEFVDSDLNTLTSCTISEVFNFYNSNYDDNNWITSSNPSEVPFFYIDNNLINSMYPNGNFYFLSSDILTYTSSAISVNQNIIDLIKIECKSIGNPVLIYGSHPVQAKVIFALPCPPEWNPAFSLPTSLPNSGNGGH